MESDPVLGALASAQPKDAAVLRAVDRRTWALSGAPHEGASQDHKQLERAAFQTKNPGNVLFCSEISNGAYLTFQALNCFEGNFQGEMPWAVHFTPSAAHLKLWRLQLELGSQTHIYHDHCTVLGWVWKERERQAFFVQPMRFSYLIKSHESWPQ
jgi:hypothetical protein